MSATVLTVNRQSRGLNALVVSEANLAPIGFPTLVIGSSRNFVLRVVSGRDGLDPISGDPQVNPTLSIGQPCDFPEGGTWTFTRGANTTDPLPFDIDSAALQTAIEDLASVGSGNVSVEALPGQYYKIEYIESLADTDIDDASVDGSELTPSSTASLNRYVEGGSGENEVQVIKLRQVPAVIQADWTGDGEQWTAPLSTGSWEALGALAAQSPFVATLEISFKLDDGSVEKLVQVPATIVCDVSAPDDFVPGQAPTFLTASQVNAKFATANTVWVSKSGNDGTGARGRFDRPFLTPNAAAIAADSGDCVVVLAGNYAADTAISVSKDLTFQGIGKPLLPNITTSSTSLVFAYDVTFTGRSITNGDSVLTAERVDFLQLSGDAALDVNVDSLCVLQNCNLRNGSTEGGSVIRVNDPTASIRAYGCHFYAGETQTGDNATNGILFFNAGSGQFRDCTAITAQSGTGTAKSIDAVDPVTVYIQGSLNATHDVDSDVTLDPDNININTEFE